jgi:putative tricarboxylic transport membrane protein
VIPYSGIYLASAILIAVFMTWFGRYRWALTAAVSIGVPVAVYLLFENWFLVPLPKGPIEDWLNL